MLENIILIRNIFYKFFLLGFIFYIFTAIFLLQNNTWAVNVIVYNFHITPSEANFLIAYFIGWSKMIIILFFLIPALVFHWTGHSIKKTMG